MHFGLHESHPERNVDTSSACDLQSVDCRNFVGIDLCRFVVRCPCSTCHLGGQCWRRTQAAKAAGSVGKYWELTPQCTCFQTWHLLHFSTIRSSLVTGLLHLNTHPTHSHWLKRAEKSTARHTHGLDNESHLTFKLKRSFATACSGDGVHFDTTESTPQDNHTTDATRRTHELAL